MAKKIVQEDETKNILKADYFAAYDWTRVIGKIDLAVRSQPQLGVLPTNYLWAETKQGKRKDLYESFIQLILTIGRWHIYEEEMPPYFLGAADAEKIAFVEYNKVMHVFSKTDFNWNVTPSDHSTKEFRELYDLLHDDLDSDVWIFKYAYDDKLLRSFIRKNFKEGRKDVRKQAVGKNNFTFVYYDWVKSVKDSIAVDWSAMQKSNIQDCDFFLADLMSKDGMSIKEKLKVVLEKTKYKILVNVDLGGIFGDAYKEFEFKDEQKAYNRFWRRYERPPKPVYQKYILDRHDLLIPQDIREKKGSYYTPEPWVRLSQEYLAATLGEDWQDEYYVWDCAAGSGNLLRGLTNRYNIYASTLDDTDVKIMHDAIAGGRLNLVKSNVFQFDFLNDGYERLSDGSFVSSLAYCSKIPLSLRKIIADPEKRKKLVVYINPPYLQSGSGKTSAGTGQNKTGATKGNIVRGLCQDQIGPAADEMFALFTWRIVNEIPSCKLAEFSKLKILQAPNFSEFRRLVDLRLRSLFIVPGDTFDNVDGDFPIGFHIWQTGETFVSEDFMCDVYDLDRNTVVQLGQKDISSYSGFKLINSWIAPFLLKGNPTEGVVGWLDNNGNDFQNQKYITVYDRKQKGHHNRPFGPDGVIPAAVYHAVRKIPEASWLNDRDQFLAPNAGWAGDQVFQTDCLVWSIVNNAVRERNGICDWIPFYEDEVDSPAPFNSRFLADFLNGKVERKAVEVIDDLFGQQAAVEASDMRPLDVLSHEARAVLDIAREIWRYFLLRPGVDVNASFLDIRSFFQGYKITGKGKRVMNTGSDDATYMQLLVALRQKIHLLESRIEPKIFEYGFLLK